MSATTVYPGGTLTLGGSNLAPAWAATPSVSFTGAGASVSATVTAAAAGSVTVAVPATALSGSVRIVTDGVPAALVAVTVAPTPDSGAQMTWRLSDAGTEACATDATGGAGLRAGRDAGAKSSEPRYE
ncbi:MAG: hypothetical protein FJZ01_10365, partial [Candidatus Sericytochromatia bacterium]|nr:hypothetical protein [Candidatus Tanganyikabacteria bacterium]